MFTNLLSNNRQTASLWALVLLFAFFVFFSGTTVVFADDSLCAVVKIEIQQELTLERQAFDAHMTINNGLSHISLEDVSINVWFTDEAENPVLATSDPNDTSASFFIKVDSMTNISSVDGSGTVAPSTSADIHWMIIPSPGSSNGLESGTLYYVGATLSYTLGGEANITEVTPDYIYVKPMPTIALDYFLPSEVYGDDAFTTEIEAPVPFSLGVRVSNNGDGTARQLKIESAQPKIVENEQGLLIGFALEGSQVNGQPATDSLMVDFGDIAPGTSGTARWAMSCTLSGKFTEFEADFSHSDELGGEVTSLINAAQTHFLVHDVLVDLVGRDQIRDFLAKDGDILRVYESDNVDTVATDLSSQAGIYYQGTQNGRPVYIFSMPVNVGFVYARLPDPYNGSKVIYSAVRDDGKVIKTDNIWLSKSRDEQSWNYYIDLFDANTTGEYTVVFDDPEAAPQAPVLQYIANVIAIEGERISFVSMASDPDGTIPSLSAAVLPVGATFTDQGDGTGVFDWKTAVGQAGSYGITFKASDSALYDTQRVILTIRSIDDTDGDGMNDAWEMANFGTLDRDGTGDFDGDGISDLDEYLASSDPTDEDHAPTVPTVISPLQDEFVTTLTPALEIQNSTDGDDDEITYQFEIYADDQYSNLVAANDNVPQSMGTTSWTLAEELSENQYYFWRVRATDGYSYSQWAYGSFFAAGENDPPQGVAISFPKDGFDVESLNPLLEVTGISDPDEEELACSFEVYEDMAMTAPVAEVHDLTVQADGVVDWTVNVELSDNTTYFWRAVVTDGQGAVEETSLASFTVNTSNHAPTVPIINFPAYGEEVSSTSVELSVVNTQDTDGDILDYYFEIDTAPGFNSSEKFVFDFIEEGVDITSCRVSNLSDNTTYYWRAMATDNLSSSRWVNGSFFVNTANNEPNAPALKNPGEEAWVGVLKPNLILADGVDVDNDSLSYRFEVYSDSNLENLVAWAESESCDWTVVTELTDQTRYYWRARVIDEHGNEGDWSCTASFFVKEEEQPQPEVITVNVSTDKGEGLENIKVYAFTEAGKYTGINATTESGGSAIFDVDALEPGVYKFRADYLRSKFWSDAVSIPETATVPIQIDVETVTVNVGTAFGTVSGARVYLFSESGKYLGVYLETDANGQVSFDLPAGETYLFRVDILRNQYWSAVTTIQSGESTAVDVDAGGGKLQVVVKQDETATIEGIKVHLFNDSEKYLGVCATTDDAGTVEFSVTEADYKLRVDYLGYKYWSETLHITTDTVETMVIPHQEVRLTLQGRYQEIDTPISGIKSYLFTSDGSYVRQYLETDDNGQATFHLPEKEYKIRSNAFKSKYWSEPFTWEDPVITVPMADARITVDAAGVPKENVPVYVFNTNGNYMGVKGVTDENGQVIFRIPEGEYDFRANYLRNKFWAESCTVVADMVNDISVSLGGGTFQLTVLDDDDAPISGVKCYVYNENDAYVGLKAITDDNGVVSFDLADGTYRFRADYLRHRFWSDSVTVTGNAEETMVIAKSTVWVRALMAGGVASGVKVYLFSEADKYLGQYALTDDNGEVEFDLPTGVVFKFRANILGSQYWSEDITASDDLSTVTIDAGGGQLQATIQTDDGTPLSGLSAYLFSEEGKYLGLSQTTDASGDIAFTVPEGSYRIRVNYLGYTFWEEDIEVIDDTTVSIIIAIRPTTITVVGDYQGVDTALEGIRVYLFNPTGKYLGFSGYTDDQGTVVFDLPEQDYMVRVDLAGTKFWSDPFTWQDTTVRIPMAEAVVTVTGAGLPSANCDVYLFSADNTYLKSKITTDDQGSVRFHLPAQTYRFRADYQTKQYWSGDVVLEADAENPVLISVGGGNVTLGVMKDDGAAIAGINCYAFADSGSYLGLKGATGDDGQVAFSLADGDVKFRADYLGYKYWSDILSVPGNQNQTITIEHSDISVTFQGRYQGVIQPLEGRKVYLFTPSGRYQGQNRVTDAEGHVSFNLPDQSYQVRCDELRRKYWSDSFQSRDTTVTVPMGQAVIDVTFSGEPAENARVYLFSDENRYLGRYETTDSNGTVRFMLPVGSYLFRANLDGKQSWTDMTEVSADLETVAGVAME